MSERTDALSEEETRERLQALRAASEALRGSCRELWEHLPPSAEELSEEDLPESPEPATQLRASVGVVLFDHLDPLVAMLVALSAHATRLRGGD